MKVLIVSSALVLIFSMFMVFDQDNAEFMLVQDRYKAVANDAADAAALYYDRELFSEGFKVYDKTSGNAAIQDIIKSGLNLDDSLTGGISHLLQNKHDYYVYYFDGDGKFSEYRNGIFQASDVITYPYTFIEDLTGYKKQIEGPTVIVTIDAGIFDFRESFINDPRLIRTSSYEYHQTQ